MSPFAVVAIALVCVGAAALFAALCQLFALAGEGEPVVGPWTANRPAPPQAVVLPRDYRVLVWGETQGWSQPEQWELLVRRLDGLELELGGDPRQWPPPHRYAPDWLERRLPHMETLTGPLPSQEKLVPPPPPTPSNWKNR